ncbi:MAG: hypothetical protein F4X72_14690 [Dehalococcoidia bacterium]|nr:hypothetical protein [Dehalococcoidia bacterium]
MKRLIIGLLSLAVLLVTAACQGTATQSLVGPSTIKTDELSVFSATTKGATPLLGFVQVYWFVDLDNDKWPDTNERFQPVLWKEIDRFGEATTYGYFTPSEFFGDKDIPESVKMSVRSNLYWSDPTQPYEIVTSSKTVKITSD